MKNPEGIPYDVIIPVVSTLIIAIVGYVIQFIIFLHNNKYEKKKVKMDAYSKFYYKLIIYLNMLVPVFMTYKINNEKGTWKDFGEFLISNASKTNINIEDKHIINKFSSISNDLLKLYREGEYYPLSRNVHRKNIRLRIYLEIFVQIENSTVKSREYCNSLKNNARLPNIQKMIRKIYYTIR